MTATTLDERALGPDLTRGVMLLCIALANSHHFLDAPRVLGGFPRDAGPAGWAIATFVDGRAFPLFGLLFGYGVAQVARRRADRGRTAVRRLLWRRAGALVAIGFCHAILLYVGDILAAYGVLLALGAWAVVWRDRWLLVWAVLFFALTALPAGGALDDATTGPGAASCRARRGSRSPSVCRRSRSSCCSVRSGSRAHTCSASGRVGGGSSNGLPSTGGA